MTIDQKKTLLEAGLPDEPILNSPTSSHSKASIGASLLAQVSTLAWNLVIPIVGGVLLGHYFDKRGDYGVTWTLSLLVLGVLIAFSNLYNLYIDHKNDNPDVLSSCNTNKVLNDEE